MPFRTIPLFMHFSVKGYITFSLRDPISFNKKLLTSMNLRTVLQSLTREHHQLLVLDLFKSGIVGKLLTWDSRNEPETSTRIQPFSKYEPIFSCGVMHKQVGEKTKFCTFMYILCWETKYLCLQKIDLETFYMSCWCTSFHQCITCTPLSIALWDSYQVSTSSPINGVQIMLDLRPF